MLLRFQVDLIKNHKINWPRFENNDYITAGIYRPLDDALRIAFVELIGWMHEQYGLSEMDSYELLSKTAEIHLAEMVDPNFVVIAKINKKFLVVRRRIGWKAREGYGWHYTVSLPFSGVLPGPPIGSNATLIVLSPTSRRFTIWKNRRCPRAGDGTGGEADAVGRCVNADGSRPQAQADRQGGIQL